MVGVSSAMSSSSTTQMKARATLPIVLLDTRLSGALLYRDLDLDVVRSSTTSSDKMELTASSKFSDVRLFVGIAVEHAWPWPCSETMKVVVSGRIVRLENMYLTVERILLWCCCRYLCIFNTVAGIDVDAAEALSEVVGFVIISSSLICAFFKT